MTPEIDFVVLWVDGSDENWRREKQKYTMEQVIGNGDERYRDFSFFKFWFRGVERFAPWVRKVHFVTWGHLPSWLNTEHPKLHIVKHEDYMPADILPLFNSSVIELYLHKIEGLSEHFVYFNDDIHLIAPVTPEFFFHDGKPRDMLAFQPVIANPKNPIMSHIFLNNTLVLSKYFTKRENVKQHPGDYFKIGYPLMYFGYNMLEMAFPQYTGFYTVHGPSPFLKKTYEEIWAKEEPLLKKVSANRFRSDTDVTQYLFREWQKLKGEFYAANIQKDFAYFELNQSREKLVNTITKQKKKVICINDSNITDDLELIQTQIENAFLQILPERSAFEKE